MDPYERTRISWKPYPAGFFDRGSGGFLFLFTIQKSIPTGHSKCLGRDWDPRSCSNFLVGLSWVGTPVIVKKWWKTGRPMFFILTGLSHYLFVWGAVGFVVLVFRKGLLQCYNVTIDCWFLVWLGVNSPCYSSWGPLKLPSPVIAGGQKRLPRNYLIIFARKCERTCKAYPKHWTPEVWLENQGLISSFRTSCSPRLLGFFKVRYLFASGWKNPALNHCISSWQQYFWYPSRGSFLMGSNSNEQIVARKNCWLYVVLLFFRLMFDVRRKGELGTAFVLPEVKDANSPVCDYTSYDLHNSG